MLMKELKQLYCIMCIIQFISKTKRVIFDNSFFYRMNKMVSFYIQ